MAVDDLAADLASARTGAGALGPAGVAQEVRTLSRSSKRDHST